MVLKKFGFRLAIRLIILLALMLALGMILGDRDLFFSQLILAVIIALLSLELYRYVNRTNRELSRFLLAIRHADFNIHFDREGGSGGFEELQLAFREVLEAYEDLRLGEQASDQFLDHLVDQMPLAIIAWTGEEILLSNRAARELLGSEIGGSRKLFEQDHPELAQRLFSIEGGGSMILDLGIKGREHSLFIDLSSIRLLDQDCHLAIFRDMGDELEQHELQAWLKLIRILTHEIMNSATPISSLTETMLSRLDSTGEDLDQLLEDIRFSLATIQRRSEALLKFVQDYRELTRVPHPKIQEVEVTELLERLEDLYKAEFAEKQIDFRFEPSSEVIACDLVLIEQVLINLTTNSIKALEGKQDAYISIIFEKGDGRKRFVFSDNGQGVAESDKSNIFIPFFSTRESGSGIGLSLARQIMYQHGGSIKLDPTFSDGARFILEFND